MKTTTKSLEPLVVPFVISIDGREQLPYRFDGLRADAADGRRPLIVETQWQHLITADYSILGMHDQIGIERKSLDDLFGTLGRRRDNFHDEIRRMSRLQFAAVVVEASWWHVLNDPPEWSKLRPKSVYRTVIAWQQELPTVHWWFCGNRRLAEVTTFRILERFWRRCKKDATCATS